MGKRRHPLQIVLIHRALGQPQKALAQIAPKVQGAIAVNPVILDLNLIENRTDLVRRQRRMIQVVAELLKRPFEVDVVLPQSVVRIKDEMLAPRDQNGTCVRGASLNGISTTASTSTGSPCLDAGVNSHFPSASSAL